MKNSKRYCAIFTTVILGFLFLIGCTVKPTPTIQSTGNPQVTAINNFRDALGLPDLPLKSRGMDTMINSPDSNGWSVAIYADSEGRIFSIEPRTNTVVEMDARDLLASIPSDAPIFSQTEIKEKVIKMLARAIPGFETLSQNLTYEEGGKIDNYFFNWYGEQSPADFNRPFIQVGVYKTGFIFAYYNTVTLK